MVIYQLNISCAICNASAWDRCENFYSMKTYLDRSLIYVVYQIYIESKIIDIFIYLYLYLYLGIIRESYVHECAHIVPK